MLSRYWLQIILAFINEETCLRDVACNDKQTLVIENKDRNQNRGQSGTSKSRGRFKSRNKLKWYHCQKPRHMESVIYHYQFHWWCHKRDIGVSDINKRSNILVFPIISCYGGKKD